MKKTFILIAVAALTALSFTACGSDDADYVPPTYNVELPLPENAANAVAFEEIKGMTTAGKKLAGITFTEDGNAIAEVDGKFVAGTYTYAAGTYTLAGNIRGTVNDVTTKGTSTENANLSINITVTIDGQTYTFNGNAQADRETAIELLTNVDLNNICRSWTVKNMSLSLSGDVSMMKTYENGDLSQLGVDANENGANLTADELAELNKTVLSIEFTKSMKLFLTYKENGKEVTQCASWTSSDFQEFLVKEISEANKFIDQNSTIQVVYNNAGGCTITFFTTIKGSKNYDAQLIINLE
ncbi:hypothetical protein SAMN06298211_11136 [Prevotellaceae bacterium MN60]|nr:hypothetical protein SAMN06298211_11136 [Prevotellaceae bacterium MN60]